MKIEVYTIVEIMPDEGKKLVDESGYYDSVNFKGTADDERIEKYSEISIEEYNEIMAEEAAEVPESEVTT